MNEECVTVFVSCIFILYVWMYLLSSITVVHASIHIFLILLLYKLSYPPLYIFNMFTLPLYVQSKPPPSPSPPFDPPPGYWPLVKINNLRLHAKSITVGPGGQGNPSPKLFPRKLTHTQQPSSVCMVSKRFCIPPPTALFSPSPLPLPPQRALLGLR